MALFNKKENSAVSKNNISITANNPYNGIDPSQQMSGFQSFLDRIGLTNYEGKYRYAQDVLSNQWETENALREADKLYNSPLEQAKRQREAGLNPDFNGVQSFEGATAGNPSSGGILPTASPEISQSLGNIAQGLFNGIQMALGLRSGLIDLRQKQINLDKEAFGTAEDMVDKILKRKGELPSALEDLSTIKNRKLRQYVKGWLDRYADDWQYGQQQTYKRTSLYNESRTAYAESFGNPLWRSDDNDMIQAIKDYNLMFYNIEKLQAEFNEKQFKYGSKNLDYEDKVGLHSSNTDSQVARNNFERDLKREMRKYFSKLMAKDNFWSQIALMSMFSSQTGMINPISATQSAIGTLLPVGRFIKYGK